MNHVLKRQASPGGIVECLLNNTKHGGAGYCFCGHFPSYHAVLRNNGIQCRSLTNVSALKVAVDKKRLPKRNISQRLDPPDKKKLTEMLKVMPFRPQKILIYRRKLLESNSSSKPLDWKSRYNCTKSYDPNLLNCNLDLKPLYRRRSCNHLQNISYSCVKNVGEESVAHQEFLSGSLDSQIKENDIRPLRVISIPQKQEIEIEQPVIPSLEEKENDNVSEETSASALNEKLEDFNNETDFEKFTVSITRDYSLLQYLNSCLDICITNSKIKEGYDLFQSYRNKKKWKSLVHFKVVQDIYNTLLFALSSKGYWYIMKNVTNWMEEDSVRLNCKSFAALLHCLAVNRESGNQEFVVEEASKLLNSIFVNNISLNDIFSKTNLTKEESEKILGIVREVVPSFEIKPVTMELSSDCPLLKNLHTVPNNMQPALEGFEPEDLENLVEEQLLMEKNFYLDVKAVSRGKLGEVSFQDKVKLQELKLQWRESLTAAVLSLQRTRKHESEKVLGMFKLTMYMNCLPVDRLVDIMMETTQSVIEISGGYSPPSDQFCRMLGHKVFQCYQLRKKDLTGFTDKTEKLFKKYVAWFSDPSGPAMNARQQWQMLLQDSERSCQVDPHVVKWPEEVIFKLGKVFLGLILREVNFTMKTGSENLTLPVLYTVMRCRGDTYHDEIKCHPMVSELFDSVGFDILHFRCEELPMLCPPKPWKAPHHGGYLVLPTDFIRKPGGVHGRTIRLEEVPVQQLYATFDSLNTLQSVPWIINEDVLDVALEVFKSGGSKELSVPLFPRKRPESESIPDDISYEERRKLLAKRVELVKNLKNNYSLWCEALYRLSLANHFRKRVFWMPQNCDFRGRVYPVPPLLNHLGSDLYRSLLIFAKGKPLGPRGLDWLKVHLINLTGSHKKRSIRERLAYASEILPEILDSAEKPLTGNKWWMKSDEPWQTLAACMELKKVISSPNPEKYICRFPIHQDGSCNGLQHYAALGKDVIGAESVNLTPYELPQDVYTVVVELVEEERARDAENGVDIAKLLEGYLQRKVIKQTVMTTVYGVTLYGAKLQITKRLQEIPNFPEEHINAAAAYLANKTFLCLRKMFTSAKEIQEWFINCASHICDNREYVQWLSPLGLPVLQPYAKAKINPKTKLMEIRPDKLKQKNAFPPNFIHSLDSSHMMLTSLYCERAGLTFAAVHDCFWTHPNTVDIMNRICREQFISLHSQPVLEELASFFKRNYSKKLPSKAAEIFESVPEKGEFNIKEVMNSVYFFS